MAKVKFSETVFIPPFLANISVLCDPFMPSKNGHKSKGKSKISGDRHLQKILFFKKIFYFCDFNLAALQPTIFNLQFFGQSLVLNAKLMVW